MILQCRDNILLLLIPTLDGHLQHNRMKSLIGVCVCVCVCVWYISTCYMFSCSYFLERSNSAKMTLHRARELFPLEVSRKQFSLYVYMSTSFFVCLFRSLKRFHSLKLRVPKQKLVLTTLLLLKRVHLKQVKSSSLFQTQQKED